MTPELFQVTLEAMLLRRPFKPITIERMSRNFSRLLEKNIFCC